MPHPIASFASLLAAAAALYLVGLSVSPVYLLHDEIQNAFHELSLAATGRSLSGDFLPVFFRQPGFLGGRDPISIYVSALFLKVLPLSEWSLRLPTALVGVANVALACVLGRHLGGTRAGLVTAAMLALTPAHFIFSRIGISPLWPLPFLLCWLIGLARYATTRTHRDLFLSTLALGISAFGYLATALLVPLYLAGTLAWLRWHVHERSGRAYAAACAGLVLPLCVLLYWQVLHPERWQELTRYYQHRPTVFNLALLQERVTAYWHAFDPAFLYLGGDPSPRVSTGKAGVFLLVSGVLLPVGVYRAFVSRGVGALVAFAFLCSPLIVTLEGGVQIQRLLPMVLFGALLSAWGADWLLSQPSGRLRQAGVVALLLAALQFPVFLYDYFGHYRVRSGAHLMGNLRGAMTEIVRASRERDRPMVLLSQNIPDGELYYRFYAIAMGAPELVDRLAIRPLSQLVEAVPEGALLLTTTSQSVGPWRLRARIDELDGDSFYAVLER